MFETKVTISLSRYEELIKTEEKYNYLYSITFNHFKDLLQQEKQNKEG